MRRIASTVALSTVMFLLTLSTAAACGWDDLADDADMTGDPSGVSITINQSSVSIDGKTSGTTLITVSSSATDTALVCELDGRNEVTRGNNTVGSNHPIKVTENANVVMQIFVDIPFIGITWLLSTLDC